MRLRLDDIRWDGRLESSDFLYFFFASHFSLDMISRFIDGDLIRGGNTVLYCFFLAEQKKSWLFIYLLGELLLKP